MTAPRPSDCSHRQLSEVLRCPPVRARRSLSRLPRPSTGPGPSHPCPPATSVAGSPQTTSDNTGRKPEPTTDRASVTQVAGSQPGANPARTSLDRQAEAGSRTKTSHWRLICSLACAVTIQSLASWWLLETPHQVLSCKGFGARSDSQLQAAVRLAGAMSGERRMGGVHGRAGPHC